jgi:glycogen debranching enzyme
MIIKVLRNFERELLKLRWVQNNVIRSVQFNLNIYSCARYLLTSHGLRSLAPTDPRYWEHYGGDSYQRDSGYHQGTVWGWLLGPFSLAHLRVYRDPAQALALLEPMADHLSAAGLGTLSEIFDGDPPLSPRGCIAQAWSVAEVLRAWQAIRRLTPSPSP